MSDINYCKMVRKQLKLSIEELLVKIQEERDIYGCWSIDMIIELLLRLRKGLRRSLRICMKKRERLCFNLGVIRFSGCDFGGYDTERNIGAKFKKEFVATYE